MNVLYIADYQHLRQIEVHRPVVPYDLVSLFMFGCFAIAFYCAGAFIVRLVPIEFM